jgi:hypothetical protein
VIPGTPSAPTGSNPSGNPVGAKLKLTPTPPVQAAILKSRQGCQKEPEGRFSRLSRDANRHKLSNPQPLLRDNPLRHVHITSGDAVTGSDGESGLVHFERHVFGRYKPYGFEGCSVSGQRRFSPLHLQWRPWCDYGSLEGRAEAWLTRSRSS